MSQRVIIFMGALLTGLVLVGLLSVVLTEGFFADFLLDRNSRFPYPFTIQNIMWLVFCVGAGELLVRHLETDRERWQIYKGTVA